MGREARRWPGGRRDGAHRRQFRYDRSRGGAGAGIFDNPQKFITWTLPTNFGEGLVILVAVLAGLTPPITPLQILWINMTTAVLLGLTLAFEPVEPDVMSRAPRLPGRRSSIRC